MKEIKHSEPVFVAYVPGLASPTDTGYRYASNTQKLGQLITGHLGKLSEDSRDKMCEIVEQDHAHVFEMFRGRSGVRIYNDTERRHIDVMLVTASVE